MCSASWYSVAKTKRSLTGPILSVHMCIRAKGRGAGRSGRAAGGDGVTRNPVVTDAPGDGLSGRLLFNGGHRNCAL